MFYSAARMRITQNLVVAAHRALKYAVVHNKELNPRFAQCSMPFSQSPSNRRCRAKCSRALCGLGSNGIGGGVPCEPQDRSGMLLKSI